MTERKLPDEFLDQSQQVPGYEYKMDPKLEIIRPDLGRAKPFTKAQLPYQVNLMFEEVETI